MTELRLAIVQDYVPRYRVPFFDGLVRRLSDAGIECVVIAGEPTGSQAARGDAARPLAWLKKASAREFRVGASGPRVYGFGNSRHWRDCDGVIHGLRGASIDLHMSLLTKKFTGLRVGAWGHIGRTVNAPNAVDVMLERWQMRHSDHVFGYTQMCAEAAQAAGVPAEKITAVMNSVDVTALLDAYRSIDAHQALEFLRAHSLTPGKVFGIIGGLDASKRIEFIAETLDCIWKSDPEVAFVVGGEGSQKGMLDAAVQRGQVVMLGYSGAFEKSMIMRVSQALINPGRIGLLAVEALAVGIPILATKWNFHAPEYDYLANDLDVFESNDTVADFSAQIRNFVNAEPELPQHSGRPYPLLDDMIENYASGVEKMFGIA